MSSKPAGDTLLEWCKSHPDMAADEIQRHRASAQEVQPRPEVLTTDQIWRDYCKRSLGDERTLRDAIDYALCAATLFYDGTLSAPPQSAQQGQESAEELVHRFEYESMALHKTQREWLVREIAKAISASPQQADAQQEHNVAGVLKEAAHVMTMASDYIRGRGLGASLSRDEILSRMGDILLQVKASPPQQGQEPPDDLTEALCRVIDAWRVEHPDLSYYETVTVIEGLARLLSNLRDEAEGRPLAKTLKFPAPLMCEECGVYPADLPSKICPGCEAYREHQR